ncbi:MAG: LysR family transcriptional regulator [Janthinobacterium lividum]
MSADPDWAWYRSFLAVAEEGSLSAAARRLGITQPTVARHIDALEQAVGVALFLRSQRGLVPTELALELRPYARMLDFTAAALLRTASGRAGEVRGRVRVSASEVVGVEHLPPILTGLRRRHPALVVELTLADAVDDLLQREADIAVRQVEPVQDTLLARRLPPITLGLHAHPDYLARRGVPDTLAALAGHDLVGFDRQTPALRTLLRRYPSLDRDAFALRADSNLAQLTMIRAGFGIGLCQVPLAARHPGLVRVLADAVAVELGLWIVMHEDLGSSARCRAVFDALVDGLSAA